MGIHVVTYISQLCWVNVVSFENCIDFVQYLLAQAKCKLEGQQKAADQL